MPCQVSRGLLPNMKLVYQRSTVYRPRSRMVKCRELDEAEGVELTHMSSS